MKALADMNISTVHAVKTARHYRIEGRLNDSELDIIKARLLVNPIIQHTVDETPGAFPASPTYEYKLKHIDLLSANEEQLAQTGRDYSLSKQEIAAVKDYYVKLERNPTDAEMETLGQTWSEHCVHKTFKAKLDFEGQTIDNLLKSTVMKATKELSPPWCLSVFRDNAGVIDFDGDWAVCFKVETPNHPSAIEPYGGAATGVGGGVRDVMGTGWEPNPSPIRMCSASGCRTWISTACRRECCTRSAYLKA